MALIYWMPEFNTNIAILDQQHRLLVDLINELHQAFEADKDRQILIKLIDKIGMFAASHFAREEHLFELHGYPHAEEHLQEHDYFEDMLFQFEDEFKAGKQNLTLNVLTFLSDWLVNHINGSDKQYVAFLKKRGVA
ncbi:MAG: bacteriohemerythrin [Desulfopila sp.]|nr:bacteriohemerythrin [Desulfopila sp.]